MPLTLNPLSRTAQGHNRKASGAYPLIVHLLTEGSSNFKRKEED
jgi:hypothetical protein